MARNSMVGRERVCVTCENPSPGPIKLLCYRWRPHGPFFPLLERLKTEENARLFSNGRVPVCTSCANYLQRQWSEYERKSISLPIEKRTYSLLSDERWERLNRKKQDEEDASRADERGHEMSSYDENENPLQSTPGPTHKSKLPVPRKSKIPKLAKPRRPQVSDSSLATSLELCEQDALSDQEMDLRVRTAATKMADNHRSKLLRKLAEMKFQEELDYIQRKVQKTMGMVHFKGREERIREIEQELEEKIGNGQAVKREERAVSDGRAILPLDTKIKDGLSELKEHIEREMTIQRQQMDKLRKNIRSEIAEAMEESYSRNEYLWYSIMEGNERRRQGRQPRRNRPYSDGDYLNKPPKANRRMPKPERMSTGGLPERDSNDENAGYRSRPTSQDY